MAFTGRTAEAAELDRAVRVRAKASPRNFLLFLLTVQKEFNPRIFSGMGLLFFSSGKPPCLRWIGSALVSHAEGLEVRGKYIIDIKTTTNLPVRHTLTIPNFLLEGNGKEIRPCRACRSECLALSLLCESPGQADPVVFSNLACF